MSLEKKLLVCELFDCYGDLLTSKQQLLVSESYYLDRSLSEIAQNQGISRQAVQEAIAKAVAKLTEYETKLHLMQLKQLTMQLTTQKPHDQTVLAMLKLFE